MNRILFYFLFVVSVNALMIWFSLCNFTISTGENIFKLISNEFEAQDIP